MSPHRRSRLITVGVAATVLGVVGAAVRGSAAGTLPKDPCALLTPADLQPVAASATIGKGVTDGSGLPLGVGCTYNWGPRTSEWGQTSLTVTVIDASKAWVGVSPEMIKQGVAAKAMTGGPNASAIAGVGDAAAFTFEARSSNATAEAFVQAKDLHVAVVFHSGNSLASKDKLVGLLKLAAGRL